MGGEGWGLRGGGAGEDERELTREGVHFEVDFPRYREGGRFAVGGY